MAPPHTRGSVSVSLTGAWATAWRLITPHPRKRCSLNVIEPMVSDTDRRIVRDSGGSGGEMWGPEGARAPEGGWEATERAAAPKV